jgi:MFS family permease
MYVRQVQCSADVAVGTLPSVMIFINNAVPPERMATANGLGQTLGAAARTVGPALGGWLWTAAVRAALPGGGALVFAVAAVLCVVLGAVSLLYPASILTPHHVI